MTVTVKVSLTPRHNMYCTGTQESGTSATQPNDDTRTHTRTHTHTHHTTHVTVYTGITIPTLVLYHVVKCAGFRHAHRCIHKHTQILHSAARTRRLPTLRRVSSLNTISCQLCAEQTRVTTRVHEAVLPSLSPSH